MSKLRCYHCGGDLFRNTMKELFCLKCGILDDDIAIASLNGERAHENNSCGARGVSYVN